MDDGKVLILRTCCADMTSHGGFLWPESGPVEAPDWEPTAECGHGLHGWLWGEGDGSLVIGDEDRKWLVVEAESAAVVALDGKVKFPRGVVVYCGDAAGASACLQAHGGHGRAVIGGTATVGYRGTATAGYRGTATAGDGGTATAGHRGTATVGYGGTAMAGDRGTATAGDRGTATAGHRGTATVGYGGTATVGHRGTATAGHRGTATAGDDGTAMAGDRGTATAGDDGTAMAGHRGIIQVKWWDASAKRYRIATGYVGEDGIEPGTPYRYADGKWSKVAADD